MTYNYARNKPWGPTHNQHLHSRIVLLFLIRETVIAGQEPVRSRKGKNETDTRPEGAQGIWSGTGAPSFPPPDHPVTTDGTHLGVRCHIHSWGGSLRPNKMNV
jgi:hypothetical protein